MPITTTVSAATNPALMERPRKLRWRIATAASTTPAAAKLASSSGKT